MIPIKGLNFTSKTGSWVCKIGAKKVVVDLDFFLTYLKSYAVLYIVEKDSAYMKKFNELFNQIDSTKTDTFSLMLISPEDWDISG